MTKFLINMRETRKGGILTLLLTGYFLLFFFQTISFGKDLQSKNNHSTRILVLHSYHQGLVWTDDIMKGMYSVFDKNDPNIDIHIEHMDTKRYFDGIEGKYLTRLREMYRDKYKENHFDIILSSDDNAFQFLLRHHKELFPDTPIVFCGVNDFEDAMLSGHEPITGVLEFLDQKESINIALKLHPGSKQLAIITDTSTTGMGNRKILQELADEFTGRTEFVFLDKDNTGTTVFEILDTLRGLPKGTPVYYSDYLRNKDGYVDQENVVPLISQTSQGPIYSHYDEILGLGVVGGKLVNGFSHGQTAARMARQILLTPPTISPPVVKESINTFMFDHLQLKRFGIDESDLPEGSIITNKPVSFYATHKDIVLLVLGIITVLTAMVVVLISNIIRRKSVEADLRKAHDELESKVEERTFELSGINKNLQDEILERKQTEEALKKSEQSYRTLSENLPGIVYRVFAREKNRINFFNRMSEPLTGYEDEELSGGEVCSIESLIHSEDRPRVQRRIKHAIETNTPFRVDYRLGHKDGSLKHFFENGRPIFGDDGNLLYIDGVILDITERKRVEEALAYSKAEFEAMFTSFSAAVVFANTERKIIMVNPAFTKLWGYTAQEAVGRSTEFLYTSKEDYENLGRKRYHTDGPMEKLPLEIMYRRKDGSLFLAESVSDQVRKVDGEIIGYFAIHLDITDRKQAEEKLRVSERGLALAQQVAHVGSWDWNIQDNTLSWSDESYRQFGLKPDEIEPTYEAFVNFVHPDDREHVTHEIEKTLSEDKPYSIEVRMILKDGIERILHSQGTVFRNDEGKPVKFIGIQQDVTDRKRAEEELRLHSEIMVNMAEGIHLIRAEDGIIVYTNPKLEEMFGYDSGEMLGKHVSIVNAPTDKSPEETAREIIGILNRDGAWHGELLNIKKNGTPFWCQASVSSFEHSRHGEVWVSIHSDISDRKKAEGALKKAHEELEQKVEKRTHELNKAHEQLLHAEKLSAIGSLSASIAHEFNNPLQGVMNIVKGVRKRASFDEDDAELMEMAANECNRMRDLIRSLQDFNRPTSGRLAPMNIHAAMDSTLLLGKKDYKTRRITIEKVYAQNMPRIKAVADQIKQVLLNLLNNAADACEGGGTITIRTEAHKENIVIRIQDTGTGVRPEDKDHIFEPFFTTKPSIKGTGLGLSVSYGIIKGHGGDINVESEPGKGATFSLSLPIDGVQNAE
ncbi:PAS domain S-box protein [Thermodesulfobacteriota bacterium]